MVSTQLRDGAQRGWGGKGQPRPRGPGGSPGRGGGQPPLPCTAWERGDPDAPAPPGSGGGCGGDVRPTPEPRGYLALGAADGAQRPEEDGQQRHEDEAAVSQRHTLGGSGRPGGRGGPGPDPRPGPGPGGAAVVRRGLLHGGPLPARARQGHVLFTDRKSRQKRGPTPPALKPRPPPATRLAVARRPTAGEGGA